jgi:hypothetical protein
MFDARVLHLALMAPSEMEMPKSSRNSFCVLRRLK